MKTVQKLQNISDRENVFLPDFLLNEPLLQTCMGVPIHFCINYV